jgi:hypothetical protein
MDSYDVVVAGSGREDLKKTGMKARTKMRQSYASSFNWVHQSVIRFYNAVSCGVRRKEDMWGIQKQNNFHMATISISLK